MLYLQHYRLHKLLLYHNCCFKVVICVSELAPLLRQYMTDNLHRNSENLRHLVTYLTYCDIPSPSKLASLLEGAFLLMQLKGLVHQNIFNMHETSVARGNIYFLASCGGYVMQYWFFRAMLISLLILGFLMMLLSCTSYVMFHVRTTV